MLTTRMGGLMSARGGPHTRNTNEDTLLSRGPEGAVDLTSSLGFPEEAWVGNASELFIRVSGCRHLASLTGEYRLSGMDTSIGRKP